MDKRWETPVLADVTEDAEAVKHIARTLEAVHSLVDTVTRYGIRSGCEPKTVAELTDVIEGAADGQPFLLEGDVIGAKTLHASSVMLQEVVNFLDDKVREFIVDYEVKHGGTS